MHRKAQFEFTLQIGMQGGQHRTTYCQSPALAQRCLSSAAEPPAAHPRRPTRCLDVQRDILAEARGFERCGTRLKPSFLSLSLGLIKNDDSLNPRPGVPPYVAFIPNQGMIGFQGWSAGKGGGGL